MSIGTVKAIVKRINGATPLSPITVFRLKDDSSYKLNAVFGDTPQTRKQINDSPALYIGTFDFTMDLFHIKDVLRKAAGL